MLAALWRWEASNVLNYQEALSAAMKELSADPRVVFMGQGVREKGTFMSTTLTEVPLEKRIEFPVAEEMQMGVAIGMALTGFIPVTIYPRFNFILLAMNQLVSHLAIMRPHVIIRVGIGSTKPLDPGPQHRGDMTEAFRLLMPNTTIVRLENPESIQREYRNALHRAGPTILVEIADLYQEE